MEGELESWLGGHENNVFIVEYLNQSQHVIILYAGVGVGITEAT